MNWHRLDQDKTAIEASYEALRKNEGVPGLVPPTWKKTFGGAFLSVWSEAVKALRTATRIFVIGFSVPRTDLHFKYLLASGLMQNISLRDLRFIDPRAHSAEFKARVRELFLPTSLFREDSFIEATAERFLCEPQYRQFLQRGRAVTRNLNWWP